jgi:hypothetical protein
MGQTIEVGNECQDPLTQVRHRLPTRTSKQATNQNTEPDLNLVEPGTVPGRIEQANAVGWVREKGSPRLHRGQMTAFAFDAKILLDATHLGHQAGQRFGLMRVELIGNEDPARLWIS